MAIIIHGDRYRAMLNEFLLTKIEEEDIGNICFQQVGATYYTVEAILAILRPNFEDSIINRRTMICGVPSKISVTSTTQR